MPTISFRRKAIFPDGSNRNNSVNVQIHSFDILASGDLRWQLRYGSTLTGATFGNISDTPTSETCCQSDVSATAINTTTGIKLMSGFAKGGQHSAQQRFPVDTVLNGISPVTLAITSLREMQLVKSSSGSMRIGDSTVRLVRLRFFTRKLVQVSNSYHWVLGYFYFA